jgi:hypothetical protein
MQNIRHHYFPLSISGIDHWTNIIFCTEEEHKLIHKTLNIPYDRIRSFRKATNGILVVNNYYLHEQYLLQLEYFKNFKKLPEDLQRRHCSHIEQLCTFWAKEWNIPVNPEIGDTAEKYFFNHFRLYYSLLKERIKR